MKTITLKNRDGQTISNFWFRFTARRACRYLSRTFQDTFVVYVGNKVDFIATNAKA